MPSCCYNFAHATSRRELLKFAGNSFGYLAFAAMMAESCDLDQEEATWSRLTAEQFFSGYSDTDSVYDDLAEVTQG